ncbi:TPA: hypothetical protein GXZ34_01505 [bacterium]|nr:hypothetical protein [bacterium]
MNEIGNFFNALKNTNKAWQTISQFHSSNFDKLNVFNKKQLIIELEQQVASIYEETPVDIVFSNDDMDLHGSYDFDSISINENILDSINPYELLFIYFHERRHKLQFDISEGHNPAKLNIDEDTKKDWKRNTNKDSFLMLANYFEAEEENLLYSYQPIEYDANNQAFLTTVEISHELAREKGSDKRVKEFLLSQVMYNPIFHNENREKNLNEIKMIWDKNDKIINACKDKLNYFKKNLETINRLRDNEFYYYFNEYIWFYLDNVERTKVMQELNYRELGEKGAREVNLLDIIEDTFKKGDENPPAAYALHKFYKAACIHELNYVLNYKSDEDYEFLQEVKLNLYKTPDKKHINFIDNIKYPLQSRVQPYGLFEADYINGKMSRLYPFGMEHLGIEGEIYEHVKAWDYYLNFYDKESLKKKIELMYGDFDIYYKKMIDKMTQNRKKQQENTKNL